MKKNIDYHLFFESHCKLSVKKQKQYNCRKSVFVITGYENTKSETSSKALIIEHKQFQYFFNIFF